MIIQNVGREKGETDVTFTVPGADLLRSIDLLEAAKEKIGFNRIISDDKIAKISVVGVGMKSHAGVASRSEEHTSELQSLMRISYPGLCTQKTTNISTHI